MRVNPLYAAGAGIAAMIVLIFMVNSKVNSSIMREVKNTNAVSEEDLFLRNVDREKHAVLSEPVKTQQPGIYIQGEDQDSWSDDRWEAYISKAVNDAQGSGEDSQKVFEQIQKTPADFQRRLSSLNKRIEYYEELKKKGPSNADIQKKLENLYVLKATLLALENKIVTTPSAGQ